MAPEHPEHHWPRTCRELNYRFKSPTLRDAMLRPAPPDAVGHSWTRFTNAFIANRGGPIDRQRRDVPTIPAMLAPNEEGGNRR
jgi:hypothetical protein